MKKRVYYVCLYFALAGVSSCATNRQKVNAATHRGSVTYANSWQLQGYPQVHQRPPIN